MILARSLFVAVLAALVVATGAEAGETLRWRVLKDGTGVEWNVRDDVRLPHADRLEMNGARTAVLLDYRIGADKGLELTPTVIWPSLRMPIGGCSNALVCAANDTTLPHFEVEGRRLVERAERISFDGVWVSESRTDTLLRIRRSVFPSVRDTAAYAAIEVVNEGAAPCVISASVPVPDVRGKGVKGEYVIGARMLPAGPVTVAPGKRAKFGLRIGAGIGTPGPETFDAFKELAARRMRLGELVSTVVLETGVPELDVAFRLAKIRVGEAVFETDGGLMHSPGGGKFYGGFWLNDNIEYVGPWFALTGDRMEQEAFLNACRIVMDSMKPTCEPIPSAVIAEGTKVWDVKERGDAAMFAVGAVRFALMSGRKDWAKRLMPGVEWALEFCRRKLLPEGVVASGCDELECRYSSGKANLNTSCMYCEALGTAATLERVLGEEAKAADYAARAAAMPAAIERYFGAELHGFRTYRYHEGYDKLRAWAAAPLAVGIADRADGTMKALLSPFIWHDHAMLTEEGDPKKVVWDRSLLYAFKGFFTAGLGDASLPKFLEYTRNRLLGEHVPYAIEQWPFRRGAHLSAEGALYCRVFTEGLFGLEPTGLGTFRATGRLPSGWQKAALRNIRVADRTFDVEMDERGARVVMERAVP